MHVGDLLHEDPQLAEAALKLRTDPDAPFPILSAKIKLTWRCNLRCGLCRLWQKQSRTARGGQDLPPELAETVLTGLHEHGLRKIHFSGGEVLLLEHFPRLVRFARNLGLQVNLTTNGTLIGRDLARLLVEERVHSVTVSVDGAGKARHDAMRGVDGAWRRTWRGVELLQRRRERKGRGPRVAVNTIITRDNVPELDALFALLCERGIDRWRLLPVDTEDKSIRPTAEQWEYLSGRWQTWQPLLSRLPLDWSSGRSAHRAAQGKYAGVFYGGRACFAPWFNLFVDADGAVYPCCMGKRDMLPCGNIHREAIGDILAGPARREIRCTMAAGHRYTICDCCDDFLEENLAFARLYDTADAQQCQEKRP